MDMLTAFWGHSKAQEFASLFSRRDITESPCNRISLTKTLHHWFDRARLAFKPLEVSETGIRVQFHWLKRSPFKPKSVLTGVDIHDQAGLDDSQWGHELFFHRKSGMPLETGQVFHISAQNPADIPSFELLQLSWDLLRVAAISGAGEASEEDYWDSDDDDDYGDVPFYQLEEEEDAFSGAAGSLS
ncbi:hypothetical protein ACHAPT_007884 [Fusarium lateritium]